MSGVPGDGSGVTNVTSDGHGHYVVFHHPHQDQLTVDAGQMHLNTQLQPNPPPINETVVGSAKVNYATLSSVPNFQQMNNIYMEGLPGNLDAASGTVVVGSDNQFYNIQNNGDTLLFCPSTPDHGPLNLMPLIDTTNPGTAPAQIHFPVGEVMGGNDVYELIALPSDSSITSFSDQPILNLASGGNYGQILPISQQQDTNTQYVFSVQDEHGMATVSTVGGVLQHPVPLSVVDSSSILTFVPASTVTTIAPSVVSQIDTVTPSAQQAKAQRTYITVVDDFSDLIKTEETGSGNRTWGFVDEEQDGLSFSVESQPHAEEEGASQFEGGDGEDSKDSVEIIEQETVGASSENGGGLSSVKSSLYDQIQSAFHGIDGNPVEQSIRVMVDGQYYEEISVRHSADTLLPTIPTNIGFNFDSTTIKKISFPVSTSFQNRTRLPQLKIGGILPKGPTQLRPKSLPSLSKRPPQSVLSTGPKNLSDFTTITLRNSMEKATLELPPAPVLVEKPKLVSTPPNNRPPVRLPGIPLVDWVNGVGKFPGLPGKICVDETSGMMEVVDFNAAEHQRRVRVPLSAVKEQPKAVRKFEYSKIKPVSTSILPKPTLPTKESANPKPDIPSHDSSEQPNARQSEKEQSSEPCVTSKKEESVDVTFCVTCGTLATKDVEFSGKRCRKCIQVEEETAEPEEESPATKFKIPKGITITKTSKRQSSTNVSSPESSKPRRLLRLKQDPETETVPKSTDGDGKKSLTLPVLKLEPPLDSVGITVTPIFQTPGAEMKGEGDEPCSSKSVGVGTLGKRRKYHRRSLIEQKKMKKKGMDKGPVRKRTLEKVLSTKTKHAKKSLLGSGSSLSDAKSPGPDEVTDSDKEKTGHESSGEVSAEPKRCAPLIEFNWPKYLQETNSKSAPSRFFRQPAFPGPNPFKIGMMLEAVDPQHQSLFCVANIVDVQGYRIRLHLTGYSEIFDFWVNADSYDIFPPGWCGDNNHPLEPPPTYDNFSWDKYLKEEGVVGADPEFFATTKEGGGSTGSDMKVGMKLEAVDIRNMSLTCVATVQNIINDRLLIHFDSWDCVYDYWTDTSSPFIHPVGYCKKTGIELTPPKNYKGVFQWDTYLKETNSEPVPSQSLRPLPPIGFKKGMKLECVDKRNPFLIRVATIADVEDHQLMIHFDGWSSDYDFQVYECSGDIHPVGWCASTGHPLQVPPDDTEPWSGSCNIFGCLGVGHIRGYKFMTHNAEFNCPYSPANLNKDLSDSLPDRFLSYKKSVIVTQQHENSNASRRGSMESQTTFARAARLRSEKRKSLATEPPVTPAKRKYTKRKSEAEILMKSKGNSSSEEDSKDRKRSGSLLLRRLSSRQSAPPAVSTSANNIPPLTMEPPTGDLPKKILLPNIESTITPVLPPTGGQTVKVNWENVVDNKKEERRCTVEGESVTPPEFSLPSSTTMTPIPTPSSSSDHLLLLCSQKAGGEVTISQCDTTPEDKSVGVDSDSDLPLNYTTNVQFLQGIVGKLSSGTVSKWKTKNVVQFVRRIPGCLEASLKFDQHKIDGEAFLLMTMTDFSEVMGLKTGPSIKLTEAIRLMHKRISLTPLPAVSITPIPPATVGN